MKTRPELLQHPHIPKPLHGLSPRSIKGQEWWDTERQKAYASTDYHCLACGVSKHMAKHHQWLEAHEDYTIDYEKGVMEIKEIVPLCHSCHNFIHSGRLSMMEYGYEKMSDILMHGLSILHKHNLEGFAGTMHLAEQMGIESHVGWIVPDYAPGFAAWDKWHLILEGEKYYSKFKDINEWGEYYSNH